MFSCSIALTVMDHLGVEFLGYHISDLDALGVHKQVL